MTAPPNRTATTTTSLATMLVLIVAARPVAAQQLRSADENDAVQQLGLRIATSGSARDTIGVLVAAVTRDGLADQAGISTGNRIVAVNGLSMRMTTDVTGRRVSSDSVVSLFRMAVRNIPVGRDVMLRVSGGGTVRTIALPLRLGAVGGDSVPTSLPVVPAPSIVQSAALQQTSLATADSLAAIDAQLAALRRRVQSLRDPATTDTTSRGIDTTTTLARWLRAADRLEGTGRAEAPVIAPTVAAPPKPTAATVSEPVAMAAMPRDDGIELARISADLAAYLGPRADSAIVVLRAGEAYEPLRAGDVILRVDDTTPDVARLTAVLMSHARATLVIMRRGRSFSLIIGEAVQR